MSTVSTLALSHEDIATVVEVQGSETTLVVQGSPGIGKSSILKTLCGMVDTEGNPLRLGRTHMPVFVDCARLDVGEITMPRFGTSDIEFNTALSSRFGIEKARAAGKPVAICLDEIGKAGDDTLTVLLPLLNELRLGAVDLTTYLPKGSFVFGTSNLASDNVSDNFTAHASNRVAMVRMASPTSDEWIGWAGNNGISPILIALSRMAPEMFAHYSDPNVEENAYIFKPGHPVQGVTFVSPRSLARGSVTLNNLRAGRLKRNQALAVLVGQIGPAAATMAVGFSDELADVVTPDEVVYQNKTLSLKSGSDVRRATMFAAAAVMRCQEVWASKGVSEGQKYLDAICAAAITGGGLCDEGQNMFTHLVATNRGGLQTALLRNPNMAAAMRQMNTLVRAATT